MGIQRVGPQAALQRALINRRAQDKSYDASEKQLGHRVWAPKIVFLQSPKGRFAESESWWKIMVKHQNGRFLGDMLWV